MPATDWDQDTEPDTGRWRPGTVAAAAVGVLVLLAATAVALSGGGDDVGPPAADAAVPAVAPLPAAAPPAQSGLDAGDAGLAGPLLTAPPASWELVNGVAVPVSATAGPYTADGPVRSGFQRSQTGALLAAVQISTRVVVTAGDGWRDVVERQVLPGTGRDVYTWLRAQVEGVDPPGTYGQVAGFRVVTFTPDVAVVQLVTRFGTGTSGSLQVQPVTVKWVGGDWLLELQPDGGVSPTGQLVPDLDGFVVWGGI